MEWKRSRILRLMNQTPHFYCISIFFLSSLALLSTMIPTKTTPCLDVGCPSRDKADFYIQEFEMTVEKVKVEEAKFSKVKKASPGSARTRRFLSGPGSSPPRCTSKCGKCTPCKPVHVPVPPGTPVTAEYYPEAWRCKCGNKLFMP